MALEHFCCLVIAWNCLVSSSNTTSVANVDDRPARENTRSISTDAAVIIVSLVRLPVVTNEHPIAPFLQPAPSLSEQVLHMSF